MFWDRFALSIGGSGAYLESMSPEVARLAEKRFKADRLWNLHFDRRGSKSRRREHYWDKACSKLTERIERLATVQTVYDAEYVAELRAMAAATVIGVIT